MVNQSHTRYARNASLHFSFSQHRPLPSLVKALTEKMAKAQFLIKKDPLDCALFYLALDKKGPLLALFKAVNNTQLFQFFSNDFRKVMNATLPIRNSSTIIFPSNHRRTFKRLPKRMPSNL